MSVTAESLRRSGSYQLRKPTEATVLRPANLPELRKSLSPNSSYARPFRPRGAGSSATDCTTAALGTVIDMTAFDQIVNIDAYNDTVVVQAGVRIGQLSRALADQGLELAGCHDLVNRTVGGSIAGGCVGPGIANDGAFFASQVISVRMVTADGRLLQVSAQQKNLLNAVRLSYGMLGIIYEAVLRVRPIMPFSVTHRRCTLHQFAKAADSLSRTDVGIKFYLMPFRDRVYLDLRRYSADAAASSTLPWRLKDWGESTVLPSVFKSINKVVPVSGIRYRMIDEISKLTQGIVNNRLVKTGSNATANAAQSDGKVRQLNYSTWVFPATDFSIVVQAYVDFCVQIQRENDFRCDMPTVGYRLSRDTSALLSPSFDEPMFALSAVSTQSKGWEDFTIDLAGFAQHWGGGAFFNQTRGLAPEHAGNLYGSRLGFFRKIRRQLDPDNRLMNPFLSQYFL
ncbi:MAG: FAD-binding oxidoreductase [Gammaproteobacteria bacterium]|nr:FAD-binding oxidoreductase [Gammaproteobacteria bacterium]